MDTNVRAVQALYPQIYHACHRRHERATHSPSEISDRDASILGHLDRARPISAATLARHIGVNNATMSAALANLVDRGLIARVQDADDARRFELRLTVKGADAMSRSSILDADRVATVLARLSANERTIALRGLGLLARASREAMDDYRAERTRDATTVVGKNARRHAR